MTRSAVLQQAGGAHHSDAGGIRFLLDGEVVGVADVAPQTTVLEYLRETLQRTGTKEGCAEGDCGACTVVLGELEGDALRWYPIASCIRLLPTIDGKALVTVESLKSADGSLHPVQQALVDCHASQCGFCTPGFVMSLFALYKSGRRADRARVDEGLSGNLCRCTGYRPIVAAAQRMHELPPATGWRAPAAQKHGPAAANAEERELALQLKALRREYTLKLDRGGQSYYAPSHAGELAALCLAHPDARLVAGATDVGLWVTKEQRELGTLIYTGSVRELRETSVSADEIAIGAAVPLADAFALLIEHYPSLAELGSRFGSLPIRHSGTLGGNVANGSPIGDSMPVLLALGARITLRRGAERRGLALEDFYLGHRKTALRPGEFLEAVHVPLARSGAEVRAYKISKRFDQDISAVCVGFRLLRDAEGRVAEIAVGCGGVAATPKRARECERALAGRRWDAGAIAAGAAALEREFAPISDMRASAAYRRAVLGNLLRRFHLETTRPQVATRAVEYEGP
ncbi:MAG TPA: xanthine dehydrogenase small subunit [Casimicrobiaceae bacterium]|nr:xanthine dehydrogenase small subunit [Casimicrobiaceae bacterium]